MRDPYEVLGVQRSADAGAIKSAFRKLAKKLHPDANKNDPKSANKFAELNTAYEILGDETKRRQFNAGEIDAEGKPKGFEGFGAGGPGGRGGFGGFGGHPGAQGGQGGFESFSFGPEGFRRSAGGPAGAGVGGGRARAGGFEDILKDMFGGFGGAGAGPSGAGDAIITVNISADPNFKRDGDNLRLELPVTLYEAVLGDNVRVPTLDGAVQLAIPAGTSSGRVFRLKGKGMPNKSGAGDLFVTVRIVLPEQSDPELEALMQKWKDGKPYDPRKE